MSRENKFSIENQILGTYFKNQELSLTKWSESFQGVRNKTVVHIPARSGSTRIRNKNIADVCGHPLLAYTIKIAKSLPVDRVIVNTDSEEIAEIASSYGAEVPFIRPKELSDDIISPYYSSFYATRWLIDEQYPVNMFVDMYPTTPFRNVNRMSEYLKRAAVCGLLYTRARIRFDPERLAAGGCPLGGQIDGEFLKGKTFFKVLSPFMALKVCHDEIKWQEYATLTNPIELIDVDDPADLELTRYIIQNKIYDFGVEL